MDCPDFLTVPQHEFGSESSLLVDSTPDFWSRYPRCRNRRRIINHRQRNPRSIHLSRYGDWVNGSSASREGELLVVGSRQGHDTVARIGLIDTGLNVA